MINDEVNEAKLIQMFNEMIPVFEDPTTDNNKLEAVLTKGNEIMNAVPNMDFKISENLHSNIKNLLEKISSWVIKSFSSVKLNTVIGFVSLVLMKVGYQPEIKREELVKILQLETFDQLMTNDKKEKVEKNEEMLTKDAIITNGFLSAFYALIVTIANKPEIITKSKNLLRSIITVLTQICGIDNVAIYYKKKRLISVFGKILKELKRNKDSQESLIHASKLFMSLFAKVGLKRPIYRDYMFKKAIPDLMSDIYLSFYNKDPEFSKYFSIYTFFAVRTVDHKTYFWTKGVVNSLIETLNKLIFNSETSEVDESHIELITLALYNLSIDNYEVQSELKDQKFLEISKQILMKYSKNNFILFNIVSTLRRIKDEEYFEKITEELLFTFFALFDYFYLNTKKDLEIEISKNSNLESLSNRFDFIILKELVAILGNIVKDEKHAKPIIEKNLHLVLIDLKLSFNSFPKLIKNTIGALINLTTNNDIREDVARVAAFIQSIYIILDKYKDNQAIIDYELKLIINVMKSDITIKTFISGDMFFYLLLFIKNFTTNDEIVFNLIKIIRTLILKSILIHPYII
jgi:hypothetical protein